LGEKLLALPEALDGSQLQPLLPFIGHVFERHVLNLTERCRNPTQIDASVWFEHWLPRNIWLSPCWAAGAGHGRRRSALRVITFVVTLHLWFWN
jgi:hypothetical protein